MAPWLGIPAASQYARSDKHSLADPMPDAIFGNGVALVAVHVFVAYGMKMLWFHPLVPGP